MQSSLLGPSAAWPATRDAGLTRMLAFVPRSGRTYAAQRNYDRGPAQRTNVSTLSPYLRQRAVTETELLRQVLTGQSLSAAEKFVQEVFWRTYWKGWLEAHPAAWLRYLENLAQRIAELERSAERRTAYADAIAGRTGIDAFDAWAHELTATNYLHNHARMWFASIWIFTLRLPWELGADFFMRNLLDGDPASNTLSWRWVAGLHTRGRTYTASRDNIRRYTDDRFELAMPLTRGAAALEDAPLPLVTPAAVPPPAISAQPSLLVLHEDDLHGDLIELPRASIRGVCAIRSTCGRSPQPMHPAVSGFSAALAAEALQRSAAYAEAVDLGFVDLTAAGPLSAALRAAAARCAATRIIAPFAPVGPARDALGAIQAAAGAAELHYAEFGRRYDAVSWPAAARGFFNLRARIPAILTELGIGAG